MTYSKINYKNESPSLFFLKSITHETTWFVLWFSPIPMRKEQDAGLSFLEAVFNLYTLIIKKDLNFLGNTLNKPSEEWGGTQIKIKAWVKPFRTIFINDIDSPSDFDCCTPAHLHVIQIITTDLCLVGKLMASLIVLSTCGVAERSPSSGSSPPAVGRMTYPIKLKQCSVSFL